MIYSRMGAYEEFGPATKSNETLEGAVITDLTFADIVALPAQGASDERADAAAKPALVACECTDLFGILGMSGAPPRKDRDDLLEQKCFNNSHFSQLTIALK